MQPDGDDAVGREHVVVFDGSGIVRGADGIARYTGMEQNLVRGFRRTVERHPDRTALVELEGESVTYRELWDRALRVAGGLREAGVRPGDRVGVALPNGVAWLLAFWGGLLAGAVVVPLNTRLAPAERRFVEEDSGAVVTIGELPDGDPVEPVDPGTSDLAALFYTSGTTGRPKGAVLTHEHFLSSAENVRRCRELDEQQDNTTLISVPLFHVTGCCSQMVTQVLMGGTTVLMPRFAAAAFLAAVAEHQVTLLTSVPTIYELVLRHPDLATTDLSSVRSLSYGGAPMAPELVHRLRAAFPGVALGNGFGLSETSGVATFLPDAWTDDHADSVGFAAPVIDLGLDRPDPDTGVGELLVRGPNVAAGYWGDAARTAETFVDGWLHTGDLATIDGHGLVRIVDRAKDMINRGGENVYCVEVENALAEHPDVLEVAVVGVPDPVLGEKVGAVVMMRPGTTPDLPALAAFARERLGDYKVPQFVRIVADPLPRNAGGKVQKAPLRTTTGWTTVPRPPS